MWGLTPALLSLLVRLSLVSENLQLGIRHLVIRVVAQFAPDHLEMKLGSSGCCFAMMPSGLASRKPQFEAILFVVCGIFAPDNLLRDRDGGNQTLCL